MFHFTYLNPFSNYNMFSPSDFIITMARGSRLSLWIGLNDRRGNNKFFWQDSSQVFYTNWDRGEPTSGFAQNKQKNIVS